MVRQLADKQWELQRLQQYPRHLIQEGRQSALAEILRGRPIGEYDSPYAASESAKEFFTDTQAKKQIYAELAKHGLNDRSISARAFEVKARVLQDCHQVIAILQHEINTLMQGYDLYQERKSRSEGLALESTSMKALAPPQKLRA